MIITNKSCVWISFEKVTIDSDQILDLDVSIPPREGFHLELSDLTITCL